MQYLKVNKAYFKSWKVCFVINGKKFNIPMTTVSIQSYGVLQENEHTMIHWKEHKRKLRGLWAPSHGGVGGGGGRAPPRAAFGDGRHSSFHPCSPFIEVTIITVYKAFGQHFPGSPPPPPPLRYKSNSGIAPSGKMETLHLLERKD